MTDTVAELVVLPPVSDDPVFSDLLSVEPPVAAPRLLGSDPHDFAGLYIRHRWSFALHARRFLHDQRDIDEVVQEGFLKLFLALPELETELQALAYCRRTITNLCIDRYRADQRRPRLVDLDSIPVEVQNEDDELDPLVVAEDAALVRDALALLSPLHRAALIKREVEEKPLAQIATELDIPVEQVKHVLHRARRSLRRLLVGTHVEPGVDLDLAVVLAANRERAARVAKPTGAAVLALLLVLAGVVGLRSAAPRGATQTALPDGSGFLLDQPGHGSPLLGLTPAATPQRAHVPVAASTPVRSRTPSRPRAHSPLATASTAPVVPVVPVVVSQPVTPVTPGSTAPAKLSASGPAVAAGPVALLRENRTSSEGGQVSTSTLEVPLAQGALTLDQTLNTGSGVPVGVQFSPTLTQSGQSVTLPLRLTTVSTSTVNGRTLLSVTLTAASQAPVQTTAGATTLVGSFGLTLEFGADLSVLSEHIDVGPGDNKLPPVTAAAPAPSSAPVDAEDPPADPQGSDPVTPAQTPALVPDQAPAPPPNLLPLTTGGGPAL